MSLVKDPKSIAAVGTAVVVSGLLVSTLIMRTSSAAFTAADTHPGNAFATGVVALTDDQTTGTGVSALGSALFTTGGTDTSTKAGDLDGNQTVQHCLTVTLNNTLQASNTRDVHLYVTNVNGGSSNPLTADLSPNLGLTVELANPASGTTVGPDCTITGAATSNFNGLNGYALLSGTDTLASAGSAHNTYGSGYAGWTNAIGKASRVYRITTTVADVPAAQNSTANATFVWEAR